MKSTYLKEYTLLSQQEKRQYTYKRRLKQEFPVWDDSLVLLTKLFEKETKKNLTVLDAGCGNGNWVIDELAHIDNKFKYIVGIDVSKDATKKNVSLNKVVVGDLERLPFENDMFDAVISLWVIEHLKNPQIVFSEIRRVLKPNGTFAFITPNKRSLLILLRILFGDYVSGKINRTLYGRDKENIFKVYYRANTLEELAKVAKKAKLTSKVLMHNFDPSYTSFNALTYNITKLLYLLNMSLFKSHLIGIMKKV